MKPAKWDEMDLEAKKEMALDLFKSPRGTFIVSQALYYAIETLKKVPAPHTEVSNIEDMEILRTIFNWFTVQDGTKLKEQDGKDI